MPLTWAQRMQDVLPQRLATSRKAAGLTQDDLAEQAEISKFSIVAYEAGRSDPGASKLAAMADVIGVSTDYLLGRTNHASGLNTGDYVLDEQEFLAVMQATSTDELEDRVQERSLGYMTQIPATPVVMGKKQAEKHRREVERHVADVAPGLLD